MTDKQKNHLETAQNNLITLMNKKKDALPSDLNQTRFIQNAMTVLMDTRDIEQCEPVEIARCLLKGAFLGLDFFNRECYVILYNQKQQNGTFKKVPTFQTDYKGEEKLVKKYGDPRPKELYAKLIREGDAFIEEIREGRQVINFKPKPLNNGEIVGAFAVALFPDDTMIYESMTKKEIEHIKVTYAKPKSRGTWDDSPGEMYRKTVSRRLCKHITKNFDSIEQAKAFEDGAHVEFNGVPKKQIAASSLDNTVDVQAEIKDMKGEIDDRS
jgi:recombination protein RecT